MLALGCGASTSEGSGGSTGPSGGGSAGTGNGDDNVNSGDGDSSGSSSNNGSGGDTGSGDGATNTGHGGDNTLASPGDGDGNAKPTPKVPAGFKTSKSPIEMSAFLVKPAEAAFKKKRWPLAISYYSGLVAARGPASKEALDLAYALVQENQYQDALVVLDEFIANTDDPEELRKQTTVRKNVASASNPFSREFRPVHATKDAVKAFKLGRKAFKDKKYGDALLYFQIGSALDPDLTGFLRELGATYDKLGATDKKIEYLSRYLHRRPFGTNAQAARKLLTKNKKRMANLTVKSALPCDQVWLNAQLVPKKLPIKKLMVGAGRYTALCYNIKYDIAYFEEASLKPGSSATIAFNWAIIVDGLKPWGRIRVENVLAPGNFTLVPASKGATGFGVVVPADGRALEVRLESGNRSRKETRYLKIAPGSKEVIKW